MSISRYITEEEWGGRLGQAQGARLSFSAYRTERPPHSGKPEIVKKKLVISGDIVEVYDYKGRGYIKNLPSDEQKCRQGGRTVERSINYEANRQKSAQRAKRDLKRLINANHNQYPGCTTKFLTLTFRDHITDIETANKKLEKFIKRLNYKLFKTKKACVRYVAVPEFTKKGRVHYHLVTFNVPFVKAAEVADIWSHGYIKINRCDDVTNLGAYVSKYLTKETDTRLEGKKRYFSSRGLFKPVELINERADALAQHLPSGKETYVDTFENEYLGTILYKQYNIKDFD